jgi:U2-associated protein SR140
MYVHLTKNDSIFEAMVFCMDNSENSVQVTGILADSLSAAGVTAERFLARLYLISDLLHNSTLASAANCYWTFRKYFEMLLPQAFERAFALLAKTLPPADRAPLVQEVEKVLEVDSAHQAWSGWAIFDPQFLLGLGAVLNLWFSETKAISQKEDLFSQFERLDAPDLERMEQEVLNNSLQVLQDLAQISGIDRV